MKGIRILTGIAVLLVALHFAHAIHHFISMYVLHGAALWGVLALAAAFDLLAFIGGIFLLRPHRS